MGVGNSTAASGSEQTPLLVLAAADAETQDAPRKGLIRWGKVALVTIAACAVLVACFANAGNVKTFASLGQGKADVVVDESALGDMFRDPLIPVYYPRTDGNIVVPVPTHFVPTTGADEAWDNDLIAGMAASSGVERESILVRDVMYEAEFVAYFTGINCEDHAKMMALEGIIKNSVKIPAVKSQECVEELNKPNTWGIPVVVSISRNQMPIPETLLQKVRETLTAELFSGVDDQDFGVFDGIGHLELNAVAVLEGPPELLAVTEQVASPPPLADFQTDFEKDMESSPEETMVEQENPSPEQQVTEETPSPEQQVTEESPSPEEQVTEEERKRLDWQAPGEEAVIIDYPPAPSHPPIPEKSPIVTPETATIKAAENPRDFMGNLPEPEVAGNDVVTLPVANVPKSGFTEKQLDMIRDNKAKNAQIDETSLRVKGFYYAVFDFFFLSDSQCSNGKLLPMIQGALDKAFEHAKEHMTDYPEAMKAERCTDFPADDNYDKPYTMLNYMIGKDRSALSAPEAFANEGTQVVKDASFFALANKLINEQLHEDKEHKVFFRNDDKAVIMPPKIIGFITLEGPPGSAETLLKTNGPVLK